jgi:hypothetical protein
MNPMQFTQLLRGQVFVAIDTLLTTIFEEQANISEAEFNVVDKLISMYVQVYCKWVEKVSMLSDNVSSL